MKLILTTVIIILVPLRIYAQIPGDEDPAGMVWVAGGLQRTTLKHSGMADGIREQAVLRSTGEMPFPSTGSILLEVFVA